MSLLHGLHLHIYGRILSQELSQELKKYNVHAYKPVSKECVDVREFPSSHTCTIRQ